MRKTIWASMFALATFMAVDQAHAQSQWGLHTGDTVRSGDNMLYGEFGWPSLNLGIAHGLNDKVDIGALLALGYGLEYTTLTEVGLGLRVPIRISPVKRDKVSVMIHFDPGVKFDSFGHHGDGVAFGLWFPVGVEVGIHIVREATLSIGMEIPLYINVTRPADAAIPILLGPGFEYHIDDHFGVGLNTKFGPSIEANNGDVAFGFITQATFVYRL